MIKLPQDVIYILDTIKAAGFKAYCVGGSIRDLLLGMKTNDFDFTTNATPNKIKEIFKNYFLLTIGEKYGTITVQYNEKFYEITTFRKETVYEDYRRPKLVEFTDDLYTDLSRRDFTINAFAYNQEEGLIDYFNGLGDLQNKIIRCVGDPYTRMKEDALRIIRAVRFAVSLGFEIEQETLKAMNELYPNLQYISVERFRNELAKIIPYLDYANWQKYNHFIAFYIPKLEQITNIEKVFSIFSKLEKNHYTRFAYLIYNCKNIDIKKLMLDLKCSKKEARFVEMIASNIDIEVVDNKSYLKKIIRKIPLDLFEKILHIKEVIAKVEGDNKALDTIFSSRKIINEIIENNEPYLIKDLQITGHDLINLGYKPGIKLHKILLNCLDIVIENPSLNDKEYLLEYVQNNLKISKNK